MLRNANLVPDRLRVQDVVEVTELTSHDCCSLPVVAVRSGTDKVVRESRVPVRIGAYRLVSSSGCGNAG